MSSRLRRLAAALLVLVIWVTTVGCSSGPMARREEATPTPIPPPPVPEKPTYVVKRGQVVDNLSFTGRVSPIKEMEMFFKTNGRVKKVYVDRNVLVEKDALLAELENDDLVRQLAQSKLEFDTAQLNLQKAIDARDYAVQKAKIAWEMKKLQLAQLEAVSYATDTAIARANLQKAEAALKATRTRYDRRAASPGVEASPEALELERTTLDWEIAKATYDKSVAREQSGKLDVELMRQQVALAKLDYDYTSKDVDPQLTKGVDRAKLSVERLEAQVASTRIYAPIKGKVTAVSAYEGRDVAAYKVVFVVADESSTEITAEPMSSQLQRLAEGMGATIIISAYPGKELVAKIIQLPYPYGGGGGGASGTAAESTDKRTHIQFDPQDLKLATGDLVKVIVVLDKKDNALWLPPAAIRTFAGRKFVVVEEDGRQRRVDVTVGIESAERYEIVDGLEENLIVVGQ